MRQLRDAFEFAIELVLVRKINNSAASVRQCCQFGGSRRAAAAPDMNSYCPIQMFAPRKRFITHLTRDDDGSDVSDDSLIDDGSV